MAKEPSSTSYWKCPKCGTQNAAATRLCYECGTADPDHHTPRPRGWLNALTWFGIGIILFVIAVIALMRAIGIEIP